MHNPQDVQIGQRLIALGMLQQAQAYHCLQRATEQQRGFLTVAVEIGYLTMAQASALHNQQATMASTVSGSQYPERSESKTAPLDRSKLQQGLHGTAHQNRSYPSTPINDSQVPFRTNSQPLPPAPPPPDSHPSSSTFHPRAPSSKSSFSGEGMLPATGDVVDGYEIKSLLGRGGMGAVYLAEKMGTSYALKVVLTDNTTALNRFEREAQAAAKVDSHPNIVSIHRYSKSLEAPYIVMDFVAGKGLDTLIDHPEMTIKRSLDIVATVAEAISFVHGHGILHRDLKPANILIRDGDQAPMVTDFGLAKQFDAESLTRSTDILGTPHYMSPEQAGSEHDQVDESSDVWALGVILYELVHKQKPFLGETMLQIARNIMFAPVTIPQESHESISSDLETVLLTALEKHKADRYTDAATLKIVERVLAL
ncbi:MAG: serine/threonine-protein kinase, partial [Planctomycetota bacterium]|nr:serine/threonine-protein kinase [Planctomycetota bacterium]